MDTSTHDANTNDVRVVRNDENHAYELVVGSADIAGHAYFIEGEDPSELIFYHTVVDDAFAGRGLSKVLVNGALADAREHDVTVVPVCPLFAKMLREHGEEYREDGGSYRAVTRKDIERVKSRA